ncbi:mitochondrial 37S ribosomal protein mS29 [Drepanopeziza brunnea f. sp. 'multigermtubi']|uniref:Small ribosomal subunit protein mS29 n=1 Tax=Marssonina brunnea f. sp. multigermtubi (strain MB_m1) TaxID=1072389 RepID=K1WDN4_MARBU|nr:ribosomal protein DAP3 [Drepanopeziza brunnea f. sp. 'multigermtubi' MB_m1]EKD15530.1 ribosomal protein DAP3 [Drepanopeziza brunnea f. sp. 'multigermtubi' MB_m1]KAJ5032541.1 hypothetical protein L3040_009142 [Drepanopeziza brunnea f. sp. 'multigermtubi']
MSTSQCWKCLVARPVTAQFAPTLAVRLAAPARKFSTTAMLAAGPPTKTPKMVAGKSKGAKTLRIKKKAFVKTGKPPAAGERKAMRKRIVLSNTNALEVEDLRDLNGKLVDELLQQDAEARPNKGSLAAVVMGEDEPRMVGQVVGLNGVTVDSLRAVEAFKTTQGWGIFRRPAVLIRGESVVMARRMMEAEGKAETIRMVLDGDKGTGKSLMMLSAMATAFAKGWVVINIPEAQEVTNAMTAYAALPNTNPTLWSQNTYIANWLSQIAKANIAVLQSFTLPEELTAPITVPKGTTLFRLCELGARDPEIAWPMFEAFWSELATPGHPPVLMCLDGLSFAMQDSLYRAQDFSLIHAHDLAVIRHFVDHLSGTKKLPNGGAVLAATSRSHAPVSKSLNLAIKQAEDRQAGRNITPKDPFEKAYDARADKVLSSVEVMRLKGLTKREARGLMEYWAKSGVLRCQVDEETVAEKWALAGNGVVAEIQRAALWMRM